MTSAVVALVLGGCTDSGRAESLPVAEDRPRVLFQAEGEHLLVGHAFLDGSDITYPFAELSGDGQTNPDWSPDGERIVFIVDDGARDDLWIADADGSGAEKLVDCAGACRWLDDPAWSPDGARIVFSRTRARDGAGWGSLEAVEVASGEVEVLLAPRARTSTAGARWAPDGSMIVFESVHKAGPGLDADPDAVTLRIVESGSHQPGPALTDPGLFAATADWSPDGEQIVYSALARPGAEAPDLFVVSPDGGEPRQLTHLADAGGFAREPTWRADSNGIVFSGRLTDRGGAGVLLAVTADGATDPTDLGGRSVIGAHPRVEPGA